ncbi:hypothetical protein LTR62_000465 [Meristemomyces frigidus]|uniref:RNA helicase n=1 Tax=Meristemomyces frigidus TaxID=1508187 RepID=A0AAN7TGP7_9PEZI|nr:hypothetical protein LTR62_000465 [Meristemomyces frigidus]
MARSPSRRDDDRYARRDERHYRRHSRDRERRYNGRDRDRDYRPRRDGSRDRLNFRRGDDRKRSRERTPVRDRDRERDRPRRSGDSRDDYDDPRRKRHRDEKYPSSPPREQSRDHRNVKSSSVRGNETPRPSTADNAEEEAKKAKLAKVEAWKKQMAEKQAAKQGSSSSTPASPAIKTQPPASPSPALRQPTGKAEAPATKDEIKNEDNSQIKDEKDAPPVPYAGKFDPKAIAKRAAAKLEKSRAALDGIVPLPTSATTAASHNGTSLADTKKMPARLGNAKVSGFGLSRAGADGTGDRMANAPKAGADLAEDERTERKLEKLPDLPAINESSDAAHVNGSDDQDDDGGDMRSDDEEAEAAREAAQKRAQEAQAEQQDIEMADSADNIKVEPATVPNGDVQTEDEDEVDPLDVFMNDLTAPADNIIPNRTIGKTGQKVGQVFDGDDGDDMDAVGDGMDDISAMTVKRKRKDIPTVNHAKVTYTPFRKAFYSEPVELAEMSKEDVDILRADLDNITCLGGNAPKPIMKFSQGGFGAQILDVIRDLKFDKPTPVQAQTLPAIMSGRDTIGIAKTGSGKTVAYLLPMFRHIKDQPPLEKLDGPIGLVLAPTRELATQIHRDCKPYIKALNLRAVCAYGGAPIKDQIAELKRGAEIVICTPGRMIDLLAANSGRVTNLKRVTYVVLDEADRMYDMGFEPQIGKILVNVRPDRQTVLFSATLPRTIEAVQKKALNNPLRIMVGGRSVVADEITQLVEVRAEDTKFRRVLELLGDLTDGDEDARCLIFVDRQESADKLLLDLNVRGYPAVSIHGGKEQVDRDQALSDFKSGASPVMVATSVAARGLDVKQLKLVINHDAPNHLEDYVHRAGRTGRAGNTGTAVTFVRPDQDRYANFLIRALKDSKREVPEDLIKLDKQFQEKVSSGEAKKMTSGFGGRGIERLDESRAAERARERKMHKTGDDNDEDDESKDDKPVDKKQAELDKMLAKATGQVKDRDAEQEAAASATQQPSSLLPSALADHLNKAMIVEKRVLPEPSASGTPSAKINDKLAKVNAAVAKINSKLGAKGTPRPGIPIDNRGPDAGAFHATLEINDFPQKARWAVTNRTNVAKILDSTGTSITTKGTFYAPGKEPEAGTGDLPKLYILVEGDTEIVVEGAMRELTRLLREGTVAALEAEGAMGGAKAGGGRYSVV